MTKKERETLELILITIPLSDASDVHKLLAIQTALRDLLRENELCREPEPVIAAIICRDPNCDNWNRSFWRYADLTDPDYPFVHTHLRTF